MNESNHSLSSSKNEFLKTEQQGGHLALRRTIRELIRGTGVASWITRLQTYTKMPLELLPQSPDYFRIYRLFSVEPELRRFPGGWVYKGDKYPDYLFMGGASFAIFRTAKKYLQGEGVDIGAGYWEFPGSTPIDLWRGEGQGTRIEDIPSASLDYVFSSHTLEHIDDWKGTVVQWIALLKRGGRLFLYLPHPECRIWRRGAPGIGEEHKWIPEPEIVIEVVVGLNLAVVAKDNGPDGMMSFFVCAEKL